jgi:molybdenum cofactor cytidylyltransferase
MSTNSLYAVVLAAGLASRYGSTKQLASFDGETLVARAVRSAERACGSRSLLVTGNDRELVTAASAPLEGFTIHNPRYRDGIATSLAQGIRTIQDVADGVLLLLADQPLVSDAHLQALISRYKATPDSICASGYAGTRGPPVIFPKRLFAELIALRGDRGAKAVIEANIDQVITLPFEKAAIDIDTPDDLQQL